MTLTLIIICIFILVIILVIAFSIIFWGKKFGVLNKKIIYSDTETKPGINLYSKTIKLVGKPDHLISQNNIIYPVEVKTGKTPSFPYSSHIIQLIAYCLLVEENYGIRPPFGYIKYPGREFKVDYTNEAKESLKKLVAEILEKKKSGEEFFCDHPQHN